MWAFVWVWGLGGCWWVRERERERERERAGWETKLRMVHIEDFEKSFRKKQAGEGGSKMIKDGKERKEGELYGRGADVVVDQGDIKKGKHQERNRKKIFRNTCLDWTTSILMNGQHF